MNNPGELLALVLESAFNNANSNLWSALPGRVEAYDRAQQRATVQPLIRRGYEGEDGERVVETLPPVTDVPVVMLGGAQYWISHPVKSGDLVLMIFASRSLDRWLATGGLVDPVDDRRNNLSDAIAIAGLRDFKHALPNPPDDAMVLNVPTEALLKLGGILASDSAIKGETFIAAILTYIAAIGSAAAASNGTPGAITAYGTAATTALNAFNAAMSTYLSAKVKVE